MGFLEMFKKKEPEKDFYQVVIIKQLLNDVEILKKEVETLKNQNCNTKNNGSSNLTPLENKILNTFLNSKPETLQEFSLILKIPIPSLKVYLSKIRKKGHIINFK